MALSTGSPANNPARSTAARHISRVGFHCASSAATAQAPKKAWISMPERWAMSTGSSRFAQK
jgi:hypothetical protein